MCTTPALGPVQPMTDPVTALSRVVRRRLAARAGPLSEAATGLAALLAFLADGSDPDRL